MEKILYLSMAVIVLSVFSATSFINPKVDNSKTYDVSIYVEGDRADLARVADLMVEYDKSNLELISSESGGFLTSASVITKEGWEEGRSLLMSTSADISKPILKLKFKLRNEDEEPDIRLSSSSSLYLSQIGPASLPSEGIGYRVRYE